MLFQILYYYAIKVSVYFIDTGEHALVAMKDIRPLDEKFKKLPPQALYGKLAGKNKLTMEVIYKRCWIAGFHKYDFITFFLNINRSKAGSWRLGPGGLLPFQGIGRG